MEAILIPAARSGFPPLCSPSSGSVSAVTRTVQSSVTLPHFYRRLPIPAYVHIHFFCPPDSFYSSSSSLSSLFLSNTKGMALTLPRIASSASVDFYSSASESVQAKLAQVEKRLERTARYFKRPSSIGFWGQLIFTVVAVVILPFSIVVARKITSLFTFYATTAGIAAAFISVFWAFGYLRLAERLQKTANQPSKKFGFMIL